MKRNITAQQKQSISQIEIAKVIAEQEALPLEVITRIIETEQKLTMTKVKEGFRVVKKNYLTLTPVKTKERKFHSKITNKDYNIAAGISVRVAVGNGFKAFVNPNKRMKEKLCRFVDSKTKESKNIQEKEA